MKKMILLLSLLLCFPAFSADLSLLARPSQMMLNQALDHVSLGVSEQKWTALDEYEGAVFVFEVAGRLGAKNLGKQKLYIATMRVDVQLSAKGAEYLYWDIRPLSIEEEYQLEGGKFKLIKRGIDIGDIEIAHDKTIGLKKYVEIAPVKVYATWGYQSKFHSDRQFLVKLATSVGMAHIDLTRDDVDSYENKFIGVHWGLEYKHGNFSIDVEYTIDRGFNKWENNDPNVVRDNTGRQARDVSLGIHYYFKKQKTKCGLEIGKRVYDAELTGPNDDDFKAKRYNATCTKFF